MLTLALTVLGCVVLAGAALLVKDRYVISILQLTLIYAIVALSVDLLLGYAGLLSVAHGALFGFAMYAVAILTTRYSVSYWLALPSAVLLDCSVGGMLGLLTLRLSGHYFTFATVVFGLTGATALVDFTDITGGPVGIGSIPRPDAIGPLQFDQTVFTMLVLLAVTATVIFESAYLRSAFGRELIATRDNEKLARALGVNVRAIRVLAFIVSAGLAGLAGALYAPWATYVSPTEAGVLVGFGGVVNALIGGSGTLPGPIVGAFLTVLLPEFLRIADTLRLLIYGALIIVIVMKWPSGIVGSLSRRIDRVGRGWAKSVQPSRDRRDLDASDDRHKTTPAVALSAVDREVQSVDSVLSVDSLTVRYGGVTALSGVSLVIRSGEVLAVIGPNGSGKSTLFDAIAGNVRPAAGRIVYCGRDMTRWPTHQRARIGVSRTFQSVQLFTGWTVADHLSVAQERAAGHERNGAALLGDSMTSAVERFQLGEYGAWTVDQLPLDAQQRVSIAMALTLRPRLLLLDEPFAGLTESEETSLMAAVADARAAGVAICLVEHKMSTVMALADRIVVLNDGKVIASGLPSVVRQDPGVLEAYLGSRYAAVRAG